MIGFGSLSTHAIAGNTLGKYSALFYLDNWSQLYPFDYQIYNTSNSKTRSNSNIKKDP